MDAAPIVTSQLPVSAWHEVIGNPTYADAILDRLVHNAHHIDLTGGVTRYVDMLVEQWLSSYTEAPETATLNFYDMLNVVAVETKEPRLMPSFSAQLLNEIAHLPTRDEAGILTMAWPYPNQSGGRFGAQLDNQHAGGKCATCAASS